MNSKFPPFPGFIQPPQSWSVEPHDGYVVMVPATRDAELRVTTFDVDEVRLDTGNWIAAVVHANRKRGRTLVACEYGPFAGYAIENVALGTRIRGWFLRAGRIPVVITYLARESVGSRDDVVVQKALETLSLVGAAAASS
jgi:hypothetical protein